ncbi:MAG TPA: type II secretion system protein [Opitutales bacterium]|nr:type II secretion system protein [Opitutales bacterium]
MNAAARAGLHRGLNFQGELVLDTNALNSSRGFSLVELLMVIGILGILMAIMASAVSVMLEDSRRSASSINAHIITAGYLIYTTDHGRGFVPRSQLGNTSHPAYSADSIEDVALGLAKFQGLDSAALWFVDTDPQLIGKHLPDRVTDGDPANATACAPDFQNTSPKAWAFVSGLPGSAPGSTPLLWTYGLDTTSGQWNPHSPWRGAGGHIAFLDGHVAWYAIAPTNLFTGAVLQQNHFASSGTSAPIILNPMGK